VRVGGLVVARQRPGTAKGVVFLLLEDEGATLNIVVPPAVYERHRLTVRTEPLVIVEGKLECFASAGGAVNVVAGRVLALDAPDRVAAEVKDFSPLDLRELERQAGERELLAAAGGGGGGGAPADDFRAVAPPVMSFAQGRRR
jgi:error-prone DNA polymerase